MPGAWPIPPIDASSRDFFQYFRSHDDPGAFIGGPIVDKYDGVILDVWGVLHDGAKPFPFVLDTLTKLRARGKTMLVLSNAPRRSLQVAGRLAEIGVARDLYDAIHTSGEETWQHLKRRDDDFHAALGDTCYHIAPSRESDVLDGLDITMKSADANTVIVPGHGTLIKRDAIVPYRDMILAVSDKVREMIGQGKSLQEVLAAKVTAPYDAKVTGGTDSSADRFVTAVYQQLKDAK